MLVSQCDAILSALGMSTQGSLTMKRRRILLGAGVLHSMLR
jgi:hypothetical protein